MKIKNEDIKSLLEVINYLSPGHSIQTQEGLSKISYLDLGDSIRKQAGALYLVSTTGGIILRANNKAEMHGKMGAYIMGLELGNKMGEAAGRVAAARAIQSTNQTRSQQ